MDQTTEFAANLAAALETAGMSRKQLGHALSNVGHPVTRQAIDGWVNGAFAPSQLHQAAIAHVLKIPVHLLFPIKFEPPKDAAA